MDSCQELSQIRQHLKVPDFFTPLNFAREKEKFFNRENYNPQFKYPPIPVADFNQLIDKIGRFSFAGRSRIEQKILLEKVRETQLIIEMILNRGQASLSLASSKLYQYSFSAKILQLAQKDSQLALVFPQQSTLSAPEVARKIRNCLQKYQIGSWKISLSNEKDFNIRIWQEEKRILVSRHIGWHFGSLDTLLAHEVDVHVLRAVNADKQQNPLLRCALPFYIKTEEGLAAFLADYFSEGGQLSKKLHALKYVGVWLAAKKTFRDVYNYFSEHGLDENLAFQCAFRIKRGWQDTSRPGFFAREGIYYQGMQEIKQYLKGGGKIEKLFAAMAGLVDLSYIPIPEKIIIPKRLKKYKGI